MFGSPSPAGHGTGAALSAVPYYPGGFSDQIHHGVMAGRSGKAPITREQRRIERFGKGNIDGIVSGEIVPQIPHPGQKEIVRISPQGKIRKVGESGAPAFAIDLAIRRIAPDHLRDFDIQQMRRVQSLPRVE